MTQETCKNCQHYHFYLMITGGPYGYAGRIPCETCSRFSHQQDNFSPTQGGGMYADLPKELKP